MFNCPKPWRMEKQTKPLRVLIVEDNTGDFILLKKYLQRTGIAFADFHRVEYLADVEAVLAEHTIDLAFLDLTLPDSSGIDSFVNLDRQLRHVPIIVLSGLADMEVALETISLGAQDYLMKGDFDEKVLAKSIPYALERKKILRTLRESNERFEIVNKATLDIIWDWNFASDALNLSSSVQEILGYMDRDVTMQWFYERICPGDVAHVKQSLSQVLENKKKNWFAEFWFMVPDGSYRYIYTRGYTLFNDKGEAYRMIGAATDLTEKHRLEQKLITQQLNQQKLITETTIRAQETERNELAKELHDNINQVLSTVKMFLSIAKEDALKHGDLIGRSYDHVTYAIEEIRKLSQSLVAPSLGDIGLKEALEELVGQINLSNRLQVTLRCENNSGRKTEAHLELMLYRIVQEQLNNILKYAKASKVTIALKTTAKAVELSVTDNGVGFDPAEKSKGIGLKNIRNRVEFYAGRLKVVSAPGKGCTVEVSIPV